MLVGQLLSMFPLQKAGLVQYRGISLVAGCAQVQTSVRVPSSRTTSMMGLRLTLLLTCSVVVGWNIQTKQWVQTVSLTTHSLSQAQSAIDNELKKRSPQVIANNSHHLIRREAVNAPRAAPARFALMPLSLCRTSVT